VRVLHVAGNLDAETGGSTAAAFHTCGYLRSAGVDAVLAGSWATERAADYISAVWPNLPIQGFARRFPEHYWNSPAHRRWLFDTVPQFDLVVTHGVMKVPFVDAARAANRHGVPYIVQPHGSLDPYDLRKHRQLKRVYGPLVVRPMLQRAATVLVTTKREADRLVDFGAQPLVQVVPLPVAPPPCAPDGLRFRERRGIPADAPVVLFLSRLDRKKGLERLFEAMAALRPRSAGLRLVIAGSSAEGGYEERLRDHAATLGVDDLVIWAGMLLGEDKWDALAGSDLLALPSYNENFGIVVIEALLVGTPVVVSDEVYVADDLRDSPAVRVCAPGVASLVSELDQLLRAVGDDRERVAPAARTAAEACSPEVVTRATIEVYESVLAARPR
jgi:glycosyltransferase involved in cell wall biosynthesis